MLLIRFNLFNLAYISVAGFHNQQVLTHSFKTIKVYQLDF